MQTLGNLEEMILLVVASLESSAYGVTIANAYNSINQSDTSLSAVYTVLQRLEKKGYVKSVMGGASAERGGRRKRLYQISKSGFLKIERIQLNRQKLWSRIPKYDF